MDWSWEWSLQTIVQLTVLLGMGWVALRWVVRHYLADMLKETQANGEQTEQILTRLEKIERELAVVKDRSERRRDEFP